MMSFPTTRHLLVLVLLLVAPWAAHALALPEGFSVEAGESGMNLVWSSTTGQPVRAGGARYEFRMASGEVFGHPREMKGKLVLTMSPSQHNKITTDGQALEVWVSGQRHDVMVAKSARASAASKAGSSSATAPSVPVDPAAPGDRETKRLSYSLEGLDLKSTDFPFPLEVVGEVTQPRFLRFGARYPLVLFLHGRHATCYEGGPDGFDTGDWPCKEDYEPIPSHLGYRYVADVLASQGYIAVSISANGINGQDWAANDGGAAARSILIRHHLKLWAQWNSRGGDPWSGSTFLDKIDMQKVVLVGHSRGGEGVNRAAIDGSKTALYKIVGLVSYGPTAFGRQVMPDIHSATILPTCDGDVYDLQGQAYIDDSRDIAYSEALRSSVIAVGCNHNFFNTEWTPGLAQAPAWDDSTCSGTKLSAEEQQKVGAAYTLALVRLAVEKDADMLQFLDGSYVKPEAIGSADVATHAVGGAGNRLLYRPEDAAKVILRNGMKGGDCVGAGSCDGSSLSPHWLYRDFAYSYPSPQATSLRWTKSGARARFNTREGPVDLTAHDWVDVRVANKPGRAGARLKLLIRDNMNRTTALRTSLSTIEGWPSNDFPGERIQARALRGSLEPVRSSGAVDLSKIVAVELVGRNSSGNVWVIDIAATQSQIKEPKDLNLPVISVENKVVTEGGGKKTVNLRIVADRPLTSPASVWVSRSFSDSGGYQLNMTAGSNTTVAQIPFKVVTEDDKVWAGPQQIGDSVFVAAITGAVTGNYGGGVTVVDDEPTPILSAVREHVTAVEGEYLRWKLRLSTPTTGVAAYFRSVKPNGTELLGSDVAQSWLYQVSWSSSTSEPLSNLGISLYVEFPYGITTATIVVPIAKDRKSERDEMVMLQTFDFMANSKPLTLVGTVPRNG